MNIPALQKWLGEPRPELVKAVATGIRNQVETLRARGLEFYGYALVLGEPGDISSIVAVSNAETDIKVPRTDDQYNYYRYAVEEWEHWDHDGFTEANALLVEANAQFASMHSKTDDFELDEFEVAHANVLLDSIAQGLEAAKADGVFAPGEPFLVVWISDFDHRIMVEAARRLNSAAVTAEFTQEFG
jgi:hypothetical protein